MGDSLIQNNASLLIFHYNVIIQGHATFVLCDPVNNHKLVHFLIILMINTIQAQCYHVGTHNQVHVVITILYSQCSSLVMVM